MNRPRNTDGKRPPAQPHAGITRRSQPLVAATTATRRPGNYSDPQPRLRLIRQQ